MSDTQNREPVDNSHRDAGIAARDASQEAKTEAVADKVAEKVEEHQQADTQNDSGEPAAQDTDASAKGGKKPGVHQRIDELTREKHDERRAREAADRAAADAQRELHRMREELSRLQPKEPPAQVAEPDTGEPTLESCDYDQAELTRRWYRWQRNQEKQQEVAQERGRKLAEKETAFRAEHPDYDAVARNPSLPITQQVAEVILETDDPPAIAYYLGQNPEEAAAIAQMSPHQIGRAIGRIEAKLSAPPPASEAPPRQPEPKTVTKAPAPVTTLSGSPAVIKSYAEMSPKEYDEARRKERQAKGLAP